MQVREILLLHPMPRAETDGMGLRDRSFSPLPAHGPLFGIS